MSQSLDFLHVLSQLVLVFLVLVLVWNMIYTHLNAAWEDSEIGRHLMRTQVAGLGVALFGGMAYYYDGSSSLGVIGKILSLMFLGYVLSERTIIFSRVQRSEEKEYERENA